MACGDFRSAPRQSGGGIVEYWVLDIAAYGSDESVAPLAAPGSYFRVKDAFPG